VRSSAAMWDVFASVMNNDAALVKVVAEPLPRFEYATGIWRPSWRPLRVIPSISTAADSLKEYLVVEAGGFERLVLIGLSQGGLVIQRCLVRMLSEGRGRELARICRVVLLATPNSGSQLLLTARRALVRGNPQEKELRPYDELIADTLRAVQRDIVHAPIAPTERSCRVPFSVYAGEQDGVVTRASAQAVFPDAGVLPGDHFTIAKPDSIRHRTYTTVRRLLMDAGVDNGPDPPTDVTVTTLKPASLEVHNAVDPDTAQPGNIPELTPYISRAHDKHLRTILGEIVAGGPSRLIILTGESSTGKTRALYEALIEQVPHAPLLRPADAKDLVSLLEDRQVRPGSVLWLNETQRFLYGTSGETAATSLRTALTDTRGIVAVGTLWTSPYWNELTALAGPAGAYGQARALLTHPGLAVRIDVPAHLDADTIKTWREIAAAKGDRRLKQALEAGTSDGRVIQHLSGGPELLDAYLAGPGGPLFTAREHALITAALGARRLGHRSPLPAALLAQAADGALPAKHRSPNPDWAEHDLRALAGGKRDDGTRTDIRGTLTALTAVYNRSGAPAAYEPADFLEQHTHELHAEPSAVPALWAALIEHTAAPADQVQLARAAWMRQLRTTAVRLWHKAVTAGRLEIGLAQLGNVLDPGRRAAVYSATHVDITDTHTVTILLSVLRHETGTEQAIKVLLERASPNLIDNIDIADTREVADLLLQLSQVEAKQQIAALLDRDPATHADITEMNAVSSLLFSLWIAGADQSVQVLAHRAVSHVDTTDTRAVETLLRSLRQVEAEQQIAALLDRDPATHVDITNLTSITNLLRELWEAGAEQQVRVLLDRDLVNQVEIGEPGCSGAYLMRFLRQAGAESEFGTLAHRALTQMQTASSYDAAELLRELRLAGAAQQVSALLDRDPAAHAKITYTFGIANLLQELREIGAEQQISTLLDRDPATHVSITDPNAVVKLLQELRAAGAEQQVARLKERAATARPQIKDFAPYGREPDGRPSPPWTADAILGLTSSDHSPTQ
jgi:hypothetical protein